MTGLLIKAINTSYSHLEDYINTIANLVIQYFINQNQLNRIPELTSQDFFMIR